MPPEQPSPPDLNSDGPDGVDETALASVMRTVPLGAAILAGSAVALLSFGKASPEKWRSGVTLSFMLKSRNSRQRYENSD